MAEVHHQAVIVPAAGLEAGHTRSVPVAVLAEEHIDQGRSVMLMSCYRGWQTDARVAVPEEVQICQSHDQRNPALNFQKNNPPPHSLCWSCLW
jgi:hypothetical protein